LHIFQLLLSLDEAEHYTNFHRQQPCCYWVVSNLPSLSQHIEQLFTKDSLQHTDKMHFTSATFLIAALAATTTAHMNMMDPPPLNYKGNPYVVSADIDYSITSPNTNETFPCKGALSALAGAGGTPVATWAPGSQQTIKIEGGASHNGGSCQMSLSYDSGKTFTVIYSKIGGCPTTPSLTFTVPADAPTGDKVLLGWSWNNNEGNREFYMNCASLTIASGSTKKRDITKRASAVAFADRPALFTGNVDMVAGQPCVKAGTDIIYPEPGPDVDNVTTNGLGPLDCADPNLLSGGSSGSGSSSGSSSSAASSVGTLPATTATSAAAPSSATTSSVSMYVSSSHLLSTSKAPFAKTSSSVILFTSKPSHANTSTILTSSAASLTQLTVIPITKSNSKLIFSSSTGGVFVTTPATQSATETTVVGTTLATSVASVASSSSTVVVVSQTTTASQATGTGTQSSGGSSMSGPCTDEGAWNCLSTGSSFQRCASGAWSAVMPMSAGTSCSPGISDNLTMSKRRRNGYVRRGVSAWEW
jgi:hypothetical protein